MEDLYNSQTEITEAISKMAINLKKDGADRKKGDYFKNKLDKLDNYWVQYEYNDDRIRTEGSRLHPYFTMSEYDKAVELHKKVKNLILLEQKQYLSTTSSEPNITPDPITEDTPSEPFPIPGPSVPLSNKVSTGSSSKLDDMLKKQCSNFRAFTRTTCNIQNKIDLIKQEWEINDSLRALQARWDIIDSLHWELDQDLQGSNTEYELSFTKSEKIYEQLKQLLNNKLSSASYRDMSAPKMDIPVFSGSFQQWVPFKNLFTEAIHNNPSLSNIQKMQYLKSKVRGEAEHLIQNLLISSENYSGCWNILSNRYDHPRLIFSSHVNLILNLPVVQQPSLSHFKRVHDTTFESLNAIKNLGVDTTSWEPLIVQILLQKIDSETQNQFLESLQNPRELLKLNEFMDYMQKKFTCGIDTRKKQEQSKTNNFPLTSKPFKTSNFYSKPNFSKTTQPKISNKTSFKCPYCNSTHWLSACNTFAYLSPQQKRNFVTKSNLCLNCLFSHGGKECTSIRRCHECQGKHHTILHEAFKKFVPQHAIDEPSTSRPAVMVAEQHPESKSQIGHMLQQQQQHNGTEILLATAMIKVRANNGVYHNLRALIDQGSQTSLISEKAAQLLALPREKCKGAISGIGTKVSQCKGIINITCASVYTNYEFTTNALIMNTLIKNLPSYTFAKPTWSHLEDIPLADPEFYISRPVDILLGADVYSNIIMSGISRSDETVPIAQQTRIGWILCGNVRTLQCNVVLHQDQIDEIQKFWEVEDISEEQNLSSDDLYCLDYYKSTTSRRGDGSYVVRYPFKKGFEEKIGTSKNFACAQFRNLERKFTNNYNTKQQYTSFIHEYLALGHMKPCDGSQQPECYLPHHCVLRSDSSTTALRVVFNASKHTSSGLSLNDLMLKGPNLQQDLQSLLIKWRQFEFAFTADIEKMFRFIWINDTDQTLQKIVWRDSPNERLRDYQLCTITYGTKAAPYLAMMTLKQLATDERHNFNYNTIKTLEESFYMDDVLHGTHSLVTCKQLKHDLIQLLKRGGFNLRKWKSNSSEIVQDTPNYEGKGDNFEFKQENSTKTLGLRWNTLTDNFIFQCKIEEANTTHTKRSMLSDISKLFDPLGWLSPLSTKLKLIFQTVWKANINWHDEIPDNILNEWISLRDSLEHIELFQVPRWLGTQENDEIELHGFCDASIHAYACVIYCRIKRENKVLLTLLAGKTRLVPVSKKLSLPRIELSGALLLAKLMNKVQECLKGYKVKLFCWTDSMVVLGWLRGDPGRWKTFVANRVSKITETIPANCWNYVKSADNPADCASRGMTVKQLQDYSLWWQGPTWLLKEYYVIDPQTIPISNEEVKKQKQVNFISKTDNNNNILNYLTNKYSSFRKLIHVLAWVQRFIKVSRNKTYDKQTFLTLQEIKQARNTIIKHVQITEYVTEITNLQQKIPISSKSKLLQLNPFIDSNNILRVGGRLKNAMIDPEMKHPIILPHCNPLTDLIIDHAHKLTFHGGARVTSANIRQKYWIIGGNRAVKKRLRTCVKCRRYIPSNLTPLMGDLPSSRCNSYPPFYHTGVDFTGHVMIKANKGRGIKTTKGYVAVFICMATKLIHLELVSDLTTSSFIAALRRMCARRGTPRHIYSDNGTNFVGTNNILQEQYEELKQIFNQDFMAEVVGMEIEWHFNAPSWPSAGGLWEAAVKSLKRHMRIVINDHKLTYEEFSTVLTQLEAVLNSRPLCPMTEDPEDLDFLSPSSFINIKQDLTFIETETDMRTRWYFTQKIVEDIWKRWRTEYLSQLSIRSKWRTTQENVKLNDIVLIKDTNLPPGKWALGRVVELHPGSDGHVRVVTLKTKNGLMKRPVVKISTLPVNNNTSQQPVDNNDTAVGQTQTSTNEQPKRRKKFNVSSLALSFVYFLCLITISQATYNFTSLRENQGIYFDKISNIQIIRDEWKIVVYYDMDPYWQGTTACKKYLTYVEQLCNKLPDNTHCNIITLQLRREYEEIEYYNRVLLNENTDTRQGRRRRRGIINGVGYLANTLFGVLDERFAEKYQQDIQLIQDNENHLRSLMKNQTIIFEAQYNILKREEQSINKQHKYLHQLNNKIDNLSNAFKHESEINSQINDVSLGSLATSNLLRNLKNIQTSLLDTLTDIFHGRFNYHMLSPEQLKQQLSLISNHLEKDITLPINNVQNDITSIYHLLFVKARMTEKYLIIELRVPLVTRDSYELFNTIPIPVLSNNSLFTITPISPYVAINLKKDSYFILSSEDVTACRRTENDNKLLCHMRKPETHLKSDKQFCVINPKTKDCIFKVLNNCENNWMELHLTNKYLYFCCTQCQVRLLCNEQITSIQLKHAGIFTMSHGCMIKTDTFWLHSEREKSSQVYTNNRLELTPISPINHLINFSFPSFTDYTIENNTDVELKEIKNRLTSLKEDDFRLNKISYHDVHHYTAIYVVLAALTIISCTYIYYRRKKNRQAIYPVTGARDATAGSQLAGAGAATPRAAVASLSMSDQCSAYASVSDSDRVISNIALVDKSVSPVQRKVLFK